MMAVPSLIEYPLIQKFSSAALDLTVHLGATEESNDPERGATHLARSVPRLR